MEEKEILDVTEEIKDYIEKIMKEECQFLLYEKGVVMQKDEAIDYLENLKIGNFLTVNIPIYSNCNIFMKIKSEK